jgi:hypothetical protein
MEDITEEEGNYVEYQTAPSMRWQPCLFERDSVQMLLGSMFHSYMKRVKETDCQAELRRLLAAGPPVYVSDKNALTLPEGDTHVCKLWYASDPAEEKSSKLAGAVEGEERERLWEELRGFLTEEKDAEEVEAEGKGE